MSARSVSFAAGNPIVNSPKISFKYKPTLGARDLMREITVRGMLIAVGLTIILATANTYLALKIGLLTSASIPAAMIAMGILRFFPDSNILENNQIQTCASAGEAVAGGVVYTLPALIIIQYWQHFDYFTCFAIALLGGVLGVCFSIPLRRVLVNDSNLRFPEGQAIAKVLQSQQAKQQSIRDLAVAGGIGGLVQFGQAGLKVIAGQWQGWLNTRFGIFGFGLGFSPTLFGTGYLIGMEICSSILIGAILGWLLGIPSLSYYFQLHPVTTFVSSDFIMGLWASKLSYVGIGAMLIAGLLTLGQLLTPMLRSIGLLIRLRYPEKGHANPGASIHASPRREADLDRDLPWQVVMIAIVLCLSLTLALCYQWFVPIKGILAAHWYPTFIILCVLYIALMGFAFSAICSYFSGLLGVSATPGSAVMIATIMLAALGIDCLLRHHQVQHHDLLQVAAAITIVIGAVIMASAAIAIDNIQDLKVGQLIGATPWRQQLMLLLGVLVASAVIPAVMSLLYNAYGIAGIFPHAGMDQSQQLTAPPAAILAAITQGMFHHQLPKHMLWIGAGIILALLGLKYVFRTLQSVSLIGVAIGMYLPLSTTTPLFLGALIAYLIRRRQAHVNEEKATLTACGLIAGSAVMDVLLAIPIALSQRADLLNVMPAAWHAGSVGLGLLAFLLMVTWFYRTLRV